MIAEVRRDVAQAQPALGRAIVAVWRGQPRERIRQRLTPGGARGVVVEVVDVVVEEVLE